MTQIVRTGQTVAGELVTFDIGWDDDLTGNESVLWSMIITSSDGEEIVQLGYKVVDDAFSAQFVNDWTTGREQTVDQDADARDREVTVRFPASIVGVAAAWPTWKAVINVNGIDVAERASAPN